MHIWRIWRIWRKVWRKVTFILWCGGIPGSILVLRKASFTQRKATSTWDIVANFRFMTEQNTWLRKGRETSLRRSVYTYVLAFCISPSLYLVILCTPVLRFLCIHSSLDRISKIRGEICALKHRHLYLEKTNGSFCISKTPFKQQKNSSCGCIFKTPPFWTVARRF